MRKLYNGIVIVLFFFACEAKIIIPEKLIGKWNPTYYIQNKTPDGNWGSWIIINTLVPLPTIEFSAKGRFLTDGKDGAECCYAGNRFSVSNNIITFTDTKSCPQMSCTNCFQWLIQRLDSDTLVLEVCKTRSKYVRAE
ncbi:hypothetical protein [Emticicia sp. BO119]|uniref:hypothetical protein n=1 Tax=Emticicia sp. BO119 TaxID=2757768 RepID=UPI0015F11254|nr:hypothetical protein [Emticicia sp. BO119]MBA4853594.1 hypothetical protein [Emticicia sp. BO119]